MSRSGYYDDPENNIYLINWRGAVKSALCGKRGQAFLREMNDALDQIENKRLIADDLEKDGDVCAIGAVGRKRGIDMSKLDPEDYDEVAATFGIAPAMAREIADLNDERHYGSPEERYAKMKAWVERWSS